MMNQQTITLTHLPGILLVVLPDGSEFARIEGSFFKAERTLNDYSTSLVRLELPQGNWRIVSTLADLTEEQAAGIVEGGKIPFDETASAYRDYSYKSEWGATWLSTAIESLESAILAEGYVFNNPYGENPQARDEDAGSDKEQLQISWNFAQSRTLPIEHTLILEKI